jgi:glutamine amidotransferase/cyclase
MKVSLLDYGAGNVRSVRNAITAAGYDIEDIVHADQIAQAECLVFPGVGSYQTAMTVLIEKGWVEPLRQYLAKRDRPYLGICLGLQTLFESSAEGGTVPGLGVVPGAVVKFDDCRVPAVPHMGWNGCTLHQDSLVLRHVGASAEAAGSSSSRNSSKYYFVHSYYAPLTDANRDWVLSSTAYGDQHFISAVQSGAVVATQFHPEKSGVAGLQIVRNFLEVGCTKCAGWLAVFLAAWRASCLLLLLLL